MEIRQEAVAGTFYPAEKSQLKTMVNKFLADGASCAQKITSAAQDHLKAIIVPHAGYIYSGPIAGEGYNLAQKLFTQKNPEILLIGLSHFILLNGAAVSICDEWQTPLGAVKSKNLREEIGRPQRSAENAAENILIEMEEAHISEHSLEVQLPFLQTIFSDFTIYPIAISNVDPKKLADILAQFASQKDVLIVVSSDLSHYLPYVQAQKKDHASIDAILSLDTSRAEKEIDACNKTGILTLIYLAKKLNLTPQLIDYRNSGDTAGDKSGVVGYASIAFFGDRPQNA
ncbi:AmmeMemoRadiSam system protein B [Candidatus Peregrinibacteria bacterium]|nr:AmmeMemoRadiSam system protein B [Candidatus Peregrinibacteria bacterium]